MDLDPSPVTVDADIAAWLVAHALDSLWLADQEHGCCPECCGPCAALLRLTNDGSVDDIAAPYQTGDASMWWVDGQVDREFLARAWRMTACHEV